MSTLATIEPMSGKAPILTTGDLTPAVTMDFENAAQDFFVAKSVPPEKQLSLNYLQNNWEDQIHNQILTSTLASSGKSFWNWSQQLLSLNCLLRNTPSVLNDTALRNHLKAHLDNELKEKVKHSKAQNDKVFKTWVSAVRILDEARTTENKRQLDLIEGALQCQAKRQATDANALCGPSHCNNATTSTSTTVPQPLPLPLIVLHCSQKANAPFSMNMTAAQNVITFMLAIIHTIVPWVSQLLKDTRLSP